MWTLEDSCVTGINFVFVFCFVYLFDCLLVFDYLLGLHIVFDATFNNISAILWRSVFLVEETGVFGEYIRPVVSQ